MVRYTCSTRNTQWAATFPCPLLTNGYVRTYIQTKSTTPSRYSYVVERFHRITVAGTAGTDRNHATLSQLRQGQKKTTDSYEQHFVFLSSVCLPPRHLTPAQPSQSTRSQKKCPFARGCALKTNPTPDCSCSRPRQGQGGERGRRTHLGLALVI